MSRPASVAISMAFVKFVPAVPLAGPGTAHSLCLSPPESPPRERAFSVPTISLAPDTRHHVYEMCATSVTLNTENTVAFGMVQATAHVGFDELATLKLVALDGAIAGRTTVTCSALAARLDASNQTASRRLQRLDDAGYIDREMTGDGQRISLTDDGERALRREYADYRRLFEYDRSVTLSGAVTSGMGEGSHYISLPGYMEQFERRLGYEPFAGTLNVDLDDDGIRARAGMDAIDPIGIDGWEDDERTYGPAFCWPATVERDDSEPRTYETAHVIAPERTHHGADQLELIAPAKLRDELALDDGDVLTIHVTEQ